MSLAIYEYCESFGRLGSLNSIFIADKKLVEECIGKVANFGEVLGKHSEVSSIINENNLKITCDDYEKIKIVLEALNLQVNLSDIDKYYSIIGLNPIEIIVEEMEEQYYEEDENEYW